MRNNVDGNKCRALSKEPYMWDLLRPAAIAVKDTVRATAPVKSAKERGGQPVGDYKRKLFRRMGALASGTKLWNVGSDSPDAMWVEVGAKHATGRTTAHHTLVNACRAHRLRVSFVKK